MWILDAIKTGDYLQLLIGLGTRLLIIFFVLPVHECAHGWAAERLGDHTAREQGRLTLNPMAHLDPFGALFLVLFGFGWAKPVPVNPFYFKNRKSGMALTALAGPLSNLLMALISAVVFNACIVFLPAAFFATTRVSDFILFLFCNDRDQHFSCGIQFDSDPASGWLPDFQRNTAGKMGQFHCAL